MENRPERAAARRWRRLSIVLVWLSIGALSGTAILAESWRPPGYGRGENVEGAGFGIDSGIKKDEEDYYLELNPMLEFPFGGFRVGVQIPLEILVIDREPTQGKPIPSVKPRSYESYEDYLKLIAYIRYGTHLYYNPNDLFNWSFFYGRMSNGYIGHRTIVGRYINAYSSSHHRAGVMADINSNWGGVEYFRSDVATNEVIAGRVYVRPFGVYTSIHNAFLVGGFPSESSVRLAMREARDPALNQGVFYQERIPDHGSSGALQQHLHRPLGEDLRRDGVLDFEEGVGADGRSEIRPLRRDPLSETDALERDRRRKRSHGFLNRWAIGHTVASDRTAPLRLETDGSGHLVIDPATGIPRADKIDRLTITGVDTEFRLSPWRWLDLTPYADLNRVEDLKNSEGIHAGIEFEMRLGQNLRLSIRPEYREMTENYIPVYFDSLYAVERYAFNPGGYSGEAGGTPLGVRDTKLNYLRGLPADGSKRKGYYLQTIIDWNSNLIVEGSYEDLDGPNNSAVFVGVYVPMLSSISLSGYYTKKNFDRFRDSFVYDDRSMAAAEIGYNLFAGFQLRVTFRRTWEFDEESSSYKPKDETIYGFGYGASF